MANLTISIDEETLKRARIRALEEGTSVNALLRDYLNEYANFAARREEAVKDLLRLSRRAKTRRGKRRWIRDDLHAR
ncbi:MAG: ribbon-helix-helix protein, CopG family [Nitrospirae bacterium]|nr:MAG: ribbon-helix-helix protein, CopG family [Nitrospirota bacterium]